MAFEAEVDEVADDDAAEVAKAELAGNFVGGFHVGFEGGGFGVGMLAEFSAVDVDGDDGLGGVDDEGAAGGERDVAAVHQLDFAFDAVLVEQGDGAFVKVDAVFGAGVGELDDFLDALGDLFVVDDDGVDVGGEDVADGAGDEVALGVELHGAGAGVALFDEGLPEAGEVGEVALDFGFGFSDAGGADDEADVLGRLEGIENLAEAAAFFVVFDFAGDAHLRHAGHHHEDAAGDGEIGGERRALGADAFLDDLDDDFVAAAEAALDGRAGRGGRFCGRRFPGSPLPSAEISRHQVGDVEEPVAAQAEIDERGLDGGFDVGDAALVDVADVAGGAGALHVEFFKASVFDEGDSAFFALGDVDEHFFCHGWSFYIRALPFGRG